MAVRAPVAVRRLADGPEFAFDADCAAVSNQSLDVSFAAIPDAAVEPAGQKGWALALAARESGKWQRFVPLEVDL
jgi:hypothetical protein